MLSPPAVRRLFLCLLFPLPLLSFAGAARASATIGTSESPPHLLAERGLVIWDPGRGQQHLFIAARVEASGGPAALIVESPLAPVIQARDDELGPALERLFSLHEGPIPPFTEARGEAEGRVLQAADAGSLGGFVEAHRMVAYPGLAEYARSFGERAFHYAAFVLPEQDDGPRTLPWTWLSYKTPRPFYPLAAPDEVISGPKEEGSSLEIFTLSPERLALSNSDFDTGIGLAQRLEREALHEALGAHLYSVFGLEEMPALWLQRFEPERLPIESEGSFFVRIPEPSPRAASEARSMSRNAKRFLALAIATAFAIAVTFLGGRGLPSDGRAA